MAELLSIPVHWKRSQSSMRFRSSQSRQILYRFFKLWVWWTWNHACKRIRTTLPYTWRIRKIHLHFAIQMVLNLNRSRLFGRQPSCRPLFIIISTNMLSDYLRHQTLSIATEFVHRLICINLGRNFGIQNSKLEGGAWDLGSRDRTQRHTIVGIACKWPECSVLKFVEPRTITWHSNRKTPFKSPAFRKSQTQS